MFIKPLIIFKFFKDAYFGLLFCLSPKAVDLCGCGDSYNSWIDYRKEVKHNVNDYWVSANCQSLYVINSSTIEDEEIE